MHHYEMKLGLLVVDETDGMAGTVGKIVEIKDNIATLASPHPGDYGMEWEATASELRVATPVERMKIKVAVENYASVNRPR